MATVYSQRLKWKEDIRIAKELCYPAIVIEKLINEPNDRRRSNIMKDARDGKYK